MSGILRLAGFTLAAAALLGAPSARAASVAFLPHQASYNLSLLKSRGGGTAVDGARGRILYNFTGSACDGYTSEFRQVSELSGGEGKRTLSDLRSTSWEDAEGKTYRFRIDTRMNEGDANNVDGIAERSGDHVTVKLKQPVAKTFTLGGDTVFPTEQVRRIIAAAREGKSLLELTVYDGSDNGEKVYNTLTVIGKPITGEAATTPDPSTANPAMKAVTRWPVTVSYYDRDVKPTSGEQTPTYAMSFELFENGVSRALKLDYNAFVIAGALDNFEIKPSKPCEK
ncbi:MAG: cell envelope integrity EipB family protein [Xanthobacteraceae bacterium]|nr:cell envelope integrity EipB family protein [Xanthobacteraceae bacterium]